MHGVFHSEASEVVLPMCINSPAVVGKKYAVSIDDKHEIRSGWEVSNALGLADPQDSAREKKPQRIAVLCVQPGVQRNPYAKGSSPCVVHKTRRCWLRQSQASDKLTPDGSGC